MDRKAVLFLALSGFGLHALASPKKGDAMPETTLIVANDLHYIAPSLTDHGEYFENMIHHSDGKVMEYIEELTDAFLAEGIEASPDALILSGDLSFNGARASHEALAEKLRAVTGAGIPVLVIPGMTEFTRIFGARVIARLLVIMMTPALETPYGSELPLTRMPAREATLTMTPPSPSFISFAASRQQKKVPIRLV